MGGGGLALLLPMAMEILTRLGRPVSVPAFKR